MEAASDFIGVAATLLLIKSRSLIPELELSSEEESDVEDLKRRLAQYERVREMMRDLSRVFAALSWSPRRDVLQSQPLRLRATYPHESYCGPR